MAQFCLLSNIWFKLGGGQGSSRGIQAPTLPREAWADEAIPHV